MGAPPPQQYNTRWQEPPPGGNDRWDRSERSKLKRTSDGVKIRQLIMTWLAFFNAINSYL
jgi:hypothetical protein